MTAKLGIVGIRSCLRARKNNKTIFFAFLLPSSTQKRKAINYYASCRGDGEGRGEKKTIVAFAQCENIQVDARCGGEKRNRIGFEILFRSAFRKIFTAC